MSHNTAELESRLRCFFYDPIYPEDDYYKVYRSEYPNEEPPAYSPLYRLRRELKSHYEQNKWYSGTLVASIIFEGLVKNIIVPNASREDYEFQFVRYFHVQGLEHTIIQLYRNSQVHDFGLLLTRVPKKGKQSWAFKPLVDFLATNTTYAHLDSISTLKIAFALSIGFDAMATCDGCEARDKYLLVHCRINPKRYIDKFNLALEEMERDIRGATELQTNLLSTMTRDNWMRVYPYKPSVTPSTATG